MNIPDHPAPTPDDDGERIAQELTDFAFGAVGAIAKQIVESFPGLPAPEATEAFVKVIVARHVGVGIEEALLGIRTVLELKK